MVAAAGLREDPSALVLLVGDGPERKALEKEAKRIGVDDHLRFEGFVAHEQLPALLAHAGLLVLPSLYEELGTVLLEATQAGIPIVASETGGIPEVIEDGVNPCKQERLPATHQRIRSADVKGRLSRAEGWATGYQAAPKISMPRTLRNTGGYPDTTLHNTCILRRCSYRFRHTEQDHQNPADEEIARRINAGRDKTLACPELGCTSSAAT